MTVLLTGGAGYVGSACLRWLMSRRHSVVCFDNLSAGNAAAVPAESLVVGDIEDRAALSAAMAEHQVKAVMHFAAVASVPESINQPELYWRTNVLGTKNVLDAMVENDVKHLVFSSTAATYSFDVPMPITEEAAQDPEVPYGTTKLAAERMIQEYSCAYSLGCGILRYFNASGADPDGCHGEDRDNESHLIPLVLHAALGLREKVLVFGGDWDTRDGSCVRDYVHTADLASAHELVLHALRPGRCLAYNVGSGVGTTVKEVLRLSEEIAGRRIKSEVVARRPGDPGTLVASPKRLKKDLGWEPVHDIRSIVDSAWQWHGSHPQGYGSKGAENG